MEGYLRGYYGYKNFGDELLFFGVVKRLMEKYPLSKLFVEVGDVVWMEDRVRANYQGLIEEKHLTKIRFIHSKQHIYKWITHLIHFLGLGKYKKIFKFFGGGEVLSDERDFPHDGWNIPLLFNYSVRKRQFVLLGGIGKIHKPRTKRLYRYLLPKAEKIVVRDKDSYTTAIQGRGERDEEGGTRDEVNNNVVLYKDFAQEIILKYKDFNIGTRDGGGGTRNYIVVNINKQSVNIHNIQKISDFCAQYPKHTKIFFPCDMNDDIHCFRGLQKYIPDLELYNRTKHTLSESLSLFYHADGGVGVRLHFLLPLKLYNKPMVAIPYADKINKLIIKK